MSRSCPQLLLPLNPLCSPLIYSGSFLFLLEVPWLGPASQIVQLGVLDVTFLAVPQAKEAFQTQLLNLPEVPLIIALAQTYVGLFLKIA